MQGRLAISQTLMPGRTLELEGGWARLFGALTIIAGLLLACVLKDIPGAREVDWPALAS